MNNKCKICGAPCRSKYCSEECIKVARKQQYRAAHPNGRNLKFYVFYDKNDFVKYFGTAKELVELGFFKNEKHVGDLASKIKRKDVKGSVVILDGED